MARVNRSLDDKDLVKITEAVLTGEITREELARRGKFTPVDHRDILAYVGVALMFATRFRLDNRNCVDGSLRDALYDLMYRNTWAEYEYNEGGVSYTVSRELLQVSAAQLELYPQGKRGQSVVLDPPAALMELVEYHGNNPAIRAFLEDACLEDEGATVSIQHRARYVAEAFRNRHGTGGLQVLLGEVQAILEEE